MAQNATQYNHELHRKNAESFAQGALDFCKKQPAYCGPGADQVSEQDMLDAPAATAAHGEGIDKVKPQALRLVNQFLSNPELADTLQNDLFAPTASEQQRLDTLEKAELAAAGVSAAVLAKAVIAGGGQLLSKVVGALKGQGTKAKISIPENRVGHIFRAADGHLPDTPANRELITKLANDKRYMLGGDRYGNTWAAETLSDGTQAWVQYRGSQVINGGINKKPKVYDAETGLSSLKPRGNKYE